MLLVVHLLLQGIVLLELDEMVEREHAERQPNRALPPWRQAREA